MKKNFVDMLDDSHSLNSKSLKSMPTYSQMDQEEEGGTTNSQFRTEDLDGPESHDDLNYSCCCTNQCDFPLSIQNGAQTFALAGTRKYTICGMILYIAMIVFTLSYYLFGIQLEILTRVPITNVDSIDIHKLMS